MNFLNSMYVYPSLPRVTSFHAKQSPPPPDLQTYFMDEPGA